MTIPYLQDEDNKRKVLFEIENMSTVEINLDDKIVKSAMKSVESSIKDRYHMIEIFMTIASFFDNRNNEMYSIYMNELKILKFSEYKIESNKWISGFLSALYTIAVSNQAIENEVVLTESIRPAVEYIEKHGYEVILRNRQ